MLSVFLTNFGTLVTMKEPFLFTEIMFKPGESAAKRQLLTPGPVRDIMETRSDPFMDGQFKSFILVKSPSLRSTLYLLLGMLGPEKWGIRSAGAVKRSPF